MIPIGEESTREENIVKTEEGNGSVAEKAPPLEEKAEDKKGKIKRNPMFFYSSQSRSRSWAPKRDLRSVERSFANTKRREMKTSEENLDDFLRKKRPCHKHFF